MKKFLMSLAVMALAAIIPGYIYAITPLEFDFASIPTTLYTTDPLAASNQTSLSLDPVVESTPGIFDITVRGTAPLDTYHDGFTTGSYEWIGVMLDFKNSLEGVSFNGGAAWTAADVIPDAVCNSNQLLAFMQTDVTTTSTFTFAEGGTTLTFNLTFIPYEAIEFVSAAIPTTLYTTDPLAASNQTSLSLDPVVESTPGIFDITVRGTAPLASYDDGVSGSHEWIAVMLDFKDSLEGISFNGGAPWTAADVAPDSLVNSDQFAVFMRTDVTTTSTFTLSDGTTTLTFNLTFIPSYLVKFVDRNGTVLKTESVASGGFATAPANPTRAGYTFTSWDKSFTNITGSTIITAQYRQNQSGWWGGGGSVSKDNCPNGDFSPSTYDGICGTNPNPSTGTQNIVLPGEVTNNPASTQKCSIAGSTYSDEENAAYLFACENDITTMRTIQAARMTDYLTRAEMAKMMVQYLQKFVPERKPDLTKDCSAFKASIKNFSQELQDFMTLSCQYEIMGIHTTTLEAIPDFMGAKYVTRAEFWTVFSRVLRGNINEGTETNYYASHLAALKNAGILSNTTPTLQEVRSWIFLQIYRAHLNTMTTPDPITPTVPVINPLVDSAWTLQLFNGKTVSGEYTLSFTDTAVSAKICNTIAGNYTVSGDTISAENLAQTKMACIDDESTTLEGKFDLSDVTYTIASTKMTDNNIERLALATAAGDTFVWIKD